MKLAAGPRTSPAPPLQPVGPSADVRPLEHPLPAGMRDLLPDEAEAEQRATACILDTLRLSGYRQVVVPAFEYEKVVERGRGALDPTAVVKFVEPDTGQVVALRSDMTPQVARLLATRLAHLPRPARLCYKGTVLRRRRERARVQQQQAQVGVELVGEPGLVGDLEVVSVATSALESSGLSDYVLALGHAGISNALLLGLDDASRSRVARALSLKDEAEVVRAAEGAGLEQKRVATLAKLCGLHGGEEVWDKAERYLKSTQAAQGVSELRRLSEAIIQAQLAPRLFFDLGDTHHLAYYTGVTFQLLAEGPGEAVASGGRYDELYPRYGVHEPAAGLAFDFASLGWAVRQARVAEPLEPRVLLGAGRIPDGLGPALREAGIACARGPAVDTAGYARAWGFTHLVESAGKGALRLIALKDGSERRLPAAGPKTVASELALALRKP